MINFLHTFNPESVLISFGFIDIYWYGLFIALSILSAFFITIKLAGCYKIKKEIIIDLAFYLVIGGIIGARIYYVFLEFNYFLNNPFDIIKIWQGGLAIHGAIFSGLAIIWLFAKKHKFNFWLLSSIIAPGLALSQAIGRWGNYFNQELFGRPTDLSFGIPINLANRPIEYINSNFFHPAFLYESIGNLLIFFILIFIHYWIIKHNKFRRATVSPQRTVAINKYYLLPISIYLILYSILRFVMEFIRVDAVYTILGLRFPQIVSLLVIILISFLILPKIKKRAKL